MKNPLQLIHDIQQDLIKLTEYMLANPNCLHNPDIHHFHEIYKKLFDYMYDLENIKAEYAGFIKLDGVWHKEFDPNTF